VRYTEMVNKVDEPDDYRKYLEFIAKQVGLEEVVPKSSPHDNLTTVHINIGQFHQAARPISAVPFAAVRSTEDVEDVEEVQAFVPELLGHEMPHINTGLAQQLAEDVIEMEPLPITNDFDAALDALLVS
jgi:hypothetical protein